MTIEALIKRIDEAIGNGVSPNGWPTGYEIQIDEWRDIVLLFETNVMLRTNIERLMNEVTVLRKRLHECEQKAINSHVTG